MARPGPAGLLVVPVISSAGPVAILGGTFDPVHLGHLRAAEQVREALRLDDFRLLPCHTPPHRAAPRAAPRHRLAMLERAVGEGGELSVDETELRRGGVSYMVDTLADFRQAQAGRPIALVIGQDAANRLDRWHRWQSLFELCHIVVMTRRDEQDDYSSGAAAELAGRRVADAAALTRSPGGCVIECSIDSLPISASHIRRLIRAGRSPRFLVPDAVLDYIRQHGLYA